jgi:hypothetical protein
MDKKIENFFVCFFLIRYIVDFANSKISYEFGVSKALQEHFSKHFCV